MICLTPEENCINNKPLKYDWDPGKAAANKAKHGLAFEDAEAFDWTTALVAGDRRADYGEPRFKALGFIDDRLCVMIFTERGDAVRIISLRRANAQERKSYGET